MQMEKTAIARLKQGDPGGLEFLVQRYQVKAVQAAYLVLHDRDRAEDVVQNAFINAYHKIGQFDDSRSFGPWFLRSVVNAAIKAARQDTRLVQLDEVADRQAFIPEEWRAGRQDLPEEALESAETQQAVWQALAQLPPERRAAIVLRYYLDFSEAELAQELGQSRSTIKWWLRAGRKHLQELLSPLKRPEPPSHTHPRSEERL